MAEAYYITTRKAREYLSSPEQIALAKEMAKRLGLLRRDLWRKYGSLQAWGRHMRKKGAEFETEIKTVFPPAKYGIGYKPWIYTVKTVIDDIHTAQEAAKSRVMRSVYRRYGKDTERLKSLNTLAWLDDPVLHRWVRKEYKRGRTCVANQIVLCAGDGANIKRRGGVTQITLPGPPLLEKENRYAQIQLSFKTGRVRPKGELSLIFKEDGLWLHYAYKTKPVPRANNDLIGLDKGYTEALYGSDGVIYGGGIGKVITEGAEAINNRGKARNKLLQLAKKNPAIILNNLGRKTMDEATRRRRATLANRIREGVNNVFKNFGKVACEDLSRRIPTKIKSKEINRKLSNWCKGEIQTALEQAAIRTSSDLIVVNPAYTSQIDHVTKTLLGSRVGDRFYRYNGDVLQADENASCNIRDRVSDTEITRYTKAAVIRSVLVRRTAKFLADIGETLESAADKGWLDRKFLAEQSGEVCSFRRTRRAVVAKPSSPGPRTNQSQNKHHSTALGSPLGGVCE